MKLPYTLEPYLVHKSSWSKIRFLYRKVKYFIRLYFFGDYVHIGPGKKALLRVTQVSFFIFIKWSKGS